MIRSSRLLFGLVFAVVSMWSVSAQDTRVTSPLGGVYVISAKPGGVNYTEGQVSVVRKDGKSGTLIKDDQLEAGDRVSTGADSRAEILLNPGSYVRLGSGSTFEFVTTSLEDLKLKLSKGSAVVEVLASDEFDIDVSLPNSTVSLTRSGVFRIDVLSDGSGRVSVWKGKMFIKGDDEVKSGRAVTIDGSSMTVAKFDRDNGDELDIWSKLRAKEIAAVNAKLQRGAMRDSLLSSYRNGRWNAFNSFGVWVFDPFRRMWSFLPFGYGWGSPYGYDYSFNMWYCNMPWYVYNNPTGGTGGGAGGNGGGSGGGNGGGATDAQIREERRVNVQTPPFLRTNQAGQREERNTSSNGPVFDNGPGRSDRTNRSDRQDSTRNNPNSDSKPSYNPPPPPPIVVMPSTTKTDKDNQ